VSLGYLLDTSTISWAVAPKPDESVLQHMTDLGPRCAIAAPVWHELVYGCERMPRGRRRTELETFLREVLQGSFPILAYDQPAAVWHGTERARLEKAGKTPPYIDGQIAAIAHVNELVLVTGNTKDFAPFTELKVEDWTKWSPHRTKRRP
jgi:tRNA(fMet)-specific endonuclease VapC